MAGRLSSLALAMVSMACVTSPELAAICSVAAVFSSTTAEKNLIPQSKNKPGTVSRASLK